MIVKDQECAVAGCVSSFCCIMGLLTMVAGASIALLAVCQDNDAQENRILFLSAAVSLCTSLVLMCLSLTCRFGPCCSRKDLVAQEFQSLLQPIIPSPTVTEGIPVNWTYHLQQEIAPTNTENSSYQDMVRPDQDLYNVHNTKYSCPNKHSLSVGSYS